MLLYLQGFPSRASLPIATMSNAFWRSLPQGAFADLSRTALGNLFLVPPSVGIIRLSEVTQAKDAVVFDCAAGSGMVGSLIFGMEETKGKNVHVLFGDIGQAGIDTCKKRIEETGWNAKAEIVDAQVGSDHQELNTG